MLCRNERYEVETAADYLKTVKGWVTTPRELEWNDARGHVVRSKGFAGSLLNFPVSSSNDLILALRQYHRQVSSGISVLSHYLCECHNFLALAICINMLADL